MRTLASKSGPFRITGMVGSSNPITILMVEDSEEDIELTLRGLERAKREKRTSTFRHRSEALRAELHSIWLRYRRRCLARSKEQTPELQSLRHIVCRLL